MFKHDDNVTKSFDILTTSLNFQYNYFDLVEYNYFDDTSTT